MKRKIESYNEKLYKCQYNAALKAVNNMYFHDESKSKLWMTCKNPFLGNVSPVNMLKIGRFSKLMSLIYAQLSENYLLG